MKTRKPTTTTLSRQQYVAAITDLFAAQSNAERAEPMSKYMRYKFPFLGIPKAEREILFKQLIATHGLPASEEMLEDVVMDLWDLPEREYHYTALALLDKTAKTAPAGRIRLLAHLITDRSWWDTVDWLATRLVGSLLKQYPTLIETHPDDWMQSGNFWLHRVALIFQLNYRAQTDEARLYRYIEQLADEKEFFIRKAIGWSLREYAKTNPDSVRQFLQTHTLSPLSRREASKHLNSIKN